MENDGSRRLFTELGCEDCWYNQRTEEQPVCGHPKGVRMIFAVRCVNHVSRQMGELLESNQELKRR
jgi:hypothetical protein